jgi:hypothetical protein
MLTIGVTPTPALSSTTGRSCASPRKNPPAGGATLSLAPGPTLSCSQFETTPPGSRFTVIR